MAFFTYKIKFPDLVLVSFMPYTYNIQGRRVGTRDRQTMTADKEFHFLISNL